MATRFDVAQLVESAGAAFVEDFKRQMKVVLMEAAEKATDEIVAKVGAGLKAQATGWFNAATNENVINIEIQRPSKEG